MRFLRKLLRRKNRVRLFADFLSFFGISLMLGFLAVLPAAEPNLSGQEQGSISQAVHDLANTLLPPGTYVGLNHFGEKCSVENRADRSLRVQSGGTEIQFKSADWSFVEDMHADSQVLQLVLKDGGLKWCKAAKSGLAFPCWQEARLHRTVWVGREPSQQPFISVMDGFTDKADCYGLRQVL